MPPIPKNIKYIDLPSHIKEALLSLEKTVVEATHKAASPYVRSVENDPDKFLIDDMKQLFTHISAYFQLYYRESNIVEKLQQQTEQQHQHTELAIRTVERFKNPQHRSGLAAMDLPMNQFEQSCTVQFQRTLDFIQLELNNLSSILEWIQNNGAVSSDSFSFGSICQQLHNRMLRLASSLAGLERDPKWRTSATKKQ